MWKNIRRNENRARKKSGRARTNRMTGMTPQGEAVWCNREIENAYGFMHIQKED
jgi:hypothetical protein|tara:strand:+ start:128 stop:289 length:162 start_codon:yes stop_codon:yes gene_type:complete